MKCYRCGEWDGEKCGCKDGQTIFCGDCREILPELPQVDLVLTDPPYAISGHGTLVGKPGKGTRAMDFFPGDDDWDTMTASVIERVELSLATAPTSAIVFCGHRQFGGVESLFARSEYKTRPFVWVKACPIPSPPGAGFDSAVELAVYASRPGRTWTPRPGEAPNAVTADSYRHGQPGKVKHPTQKPMSLFARLVAWCSSEGQFVLDPFTGSGTTLCACKDLGRRGIGIEIEEKYCEIAANRLRQEVLF